MSMAKATPRGEGGGKAAQTRSVAVLREELAQMAFRVRLTGMLARALPSFTFSRLRTALYRLAGVQIGPHTLVMGAMDLRGAGRIWERLRIGAFCQITTPLYADLNAEITVGDHVAVGHHVVLITTDHAIGSAEHRCGPHRAAPIRIESGAWLGACSTVLPGVTIGTGSVVAAGAVVAQDVEPHTVVGGVPARLIRRLEKDDA